MARSSEPIFRQLARTLGEQIDEGAIPVGDLLPTEGALALRHGVSRHTVREALSELRARGLIESKQGIGSIVVRQRSSEAYTETYSSIEELTRFAAGTPLRARSVDEVTADGSLASALRGRPGQAYLRIIGVRYDGPPQGIPVGHVTVHVDGTYGGVAKEIPKINTSVAEAIGRLYGVEIGRIEQEISVALLPAEPARVLHVEPDSPALSITRWYYSGNGRVFETARSLYPMGRFSYRNVLQRRMER